MFQHDDEVYETTVMTMILMRVGVVLWLTMQTHSNRFASHIHCAQVITFSLRYSFLLSLRTLTLAQITVVVAAVAVSVPVRTFRTKARVFHRITFSHIILTFVFLPSFFLSFTRHRMEICCFVCVQFFNVLLITVQGCQMT